MLSNIINSPVSLINPTRLKVKIILFSAMTSYIQNVIFRTVFLGIQRHKREPVTSSTY